MWERERRIGRSKERERGRERERESKVGEEVWSEKGGMKRMRREGEERERKGVKRARERKRERGRRGNSPTSSTHELLQIQSYIDIVA